MQVRIKLAQAKVTKVRCVCCVVVLSFPEFHYSDTTDLLLTCCGLVSDIMSRYFCRVANKTATSWQLPGPRRSYGETGLMDFGQ